jgi:hypothetical protein
LQSKQRIELFSSLEIKRLALFRNRAPGGTGQFRMPRPRQAGSSPQYPDLSGDIEAVIGNLNHAIALAISLRKRPIAGSRFQPPKSIEDNVEKVVTNRSIAEKSHCGSGFPD